MTIKEKVLLELNKKEFPDLKFLFSEDVLDISIEILEELLEKEKQDFDKLLQIENKDLTFESFEDDSVMDYFWSLLNHLENVDSSDKVRNIIETFRPKLQDFSNEVSYSKELFEKYVYVKENCKLDQEQERIMLLRVKSFKDR
jgi:Zn-dependent oligopeptidase